jgi:hypothetical protein
MSQSETPSEVVSAVEWPQHSEHRNPMIEGHGSVFAVMSTHL